MSWLKTSLNRKFAIGTAAGLLISSLFFLALFIGLFREQLQTERTAAAQNITGLLQISLENAMLKHDLDGLKEIVHRLGDQDSVLAVRITNPSGEVRFASDPAALADRIPVDQVNTAGTQLMETEGVTVLRSINPVRNKAPCQQCHGPVETNPVNGILIVDYDAASIRQRARDTTLMLMAAGGTVVIINLIGGWWFICRFVLRPLRRLSNVSTRISNGDLSARTNIDSADEMGAVSRNIDRMATNLQTRIRELHEKEQFLQALVDAFPDGVRVIDRDYNVLLSNRSYQEQLGLQPDNRLSGICYIDAHHLDQPCAESMISCPLREIDKQGKATRVIHRHQRLDGSHLDVEIYASPMVTNTENGSQRFVVESIRDLDQQVRFSHEQKLSELGRLAAGVAHEIHNPMTSVRFALDAAAQANRQQPNNTAEVAEYLSLVDHEIDKCSQVTQRLLKLSVPPPTQPELVHVQQVLDDTLKLLRWEAQSVKVDIQLKAPDEPLRILAADSELRMVTLNLAQNALHAMFDGGTLTVEAERQDGSIEVHFTDTGPGIDPQTQMRIFEPFFSRRADRVRGTGLGLAITKTIIESHGGRILVNSSLGAGSRFTIRFPDADATTEE